MRNGRMLLPVGACLAVLALSVLIAGCEDSGSSESAESFRLEPAEMTFSQTSMTTRMRIVNGQPPYIWRVADGNMGKLTGLPANAATVPTHISEANYERLPGAVGVNTVTIYDNRGWSVSSRLVAPAPDLD